MMLPTPTLLALLPILATLDLTTAAALPGDGPRLPNRAGFASLLRRVAPAPIKRAAALDAWSSFNDFDWSPFENWGFFDHSVEYVKQWYYANYGLNVSPGLNSWQEVSEYVSFFGTAPAELAAAPCVTAYSRGMEHPYEYPATRCASGPAGEQSSLANGAQPLSATDPRGTAASPTTQPTVPAPDLPAIPVDPLEQGSSESDDHQDSSIGSTENGGYVVPWTNRPDDSPYSFDFGTSSGSQESTPESELNTAFPWDTELASESSAVSPMVDSQGGSVGSTENGGYVVPWDNQPSEPTFSFHSEEANNDAPPSDSVAWENQPNSSGEDMSDHHDSIGFIALWNR